MTAKEFWKKRFGEYPQTDADKLAVAMMQQYYYETTEEEKIISSSPMLSAVRPAVSWFGTRMEAKLAVNDHKPNWNTQKMEYLHERLEQEAGELYEAFRYYNSLPPDVPNDKAREKAIDECADVANFAMMIADNLLEDGKHGR